MKKNLREKFLEALAKMPNITVACKRTGVSRNTIYQWCKKEPEFAKLVEAAYAAGTESVNDLAENRLISHIDNGNLKAIQYWLDNHNKNYARPRPKNFWEMLEQKDAPITKIIIKRASSKDVKDGMVGSSQ